MTNLREIWLLKLGGSAITYKKENRREARIEVIRSAARQIQRARTERSFSLVVVHGAGPFGHSLVAQYGINAGVHEARQVEGLVHTHRSVETLNAIVVDLFQAEGLLSFTIQPSACVVQRDRGITSFFTEPLERLLALDERIIPVLYGDMVVDQAMGASVVSGDALVSFLARQLDAQRVLMGTDVPGIFTGDPRDPSSRRIDRLDPQNLEQVLASVGESTAIDVTAGMRGKLAQLAIAAKPTLIFDLTDPEALYRALTGRDVVGTELRF